MEHLTHERLSALNTLGHALKHGLEEVLQRTDTAARVTGFGSPLNIHFSEAPVVDHPGAIRADRQN